MRITIPVLTIVLMTTLAVSAQDASSPSAPSTSGTTLTGCLKGSADQYYVVEKNGTRHTLHGKNEDLGPYVNHMVTVTGKADTSRVSGSDAEGHRKGYFNVNNVADQGPCKK